MMTGCLHHWLHSPLMENLNPFSLAVTLDGYDDPADAIDALFLGEFVAGTYPVSRTLRLPARRGRTRG